MFYDFLTVHPIIVAQYSVKCMDFFSELENKHAFKKELWCH